jgi:hypothetical protein
MRFTHTIGLYEHIGGGYEIQIRTLGGEIAYLNELPDTAGIVWVGGKSPYNGPDVETRAGIEALHEHMKRAAQ